MHHHELPEERRSRTLTPADIEALTEAIQLGHYCSTEEHREQHEILKRWIENDNRRSERNERIKTQVGGWAIIAILGAIGQSSYTAFQYLKEHLK